MSAPAAGGRSIRRALVAILALQVAVGAILVGGDVAQGLQGGIAPSGAPGLDAPVQPGDQTRRFGPGRPGGTPMPALRDMPSRLTAIPGGDNEHATLTLRGRIAPGDADRIAEVVGAQRPDLVRLDSPGGSVGDALTIGRLFREAGVQTEILDGAVCLSACPYMLAGGPERMVHPDAQVGVHQHYFGQSSVLPAFMAVEDIQRGQGEVMAFLDEMGIDLRLMRHALTTPPDEIYILMPEELADYRLTTLVPGDRD